MTATTISKRLSTELDSRFISIADTPARCVHNVFTVPTSTGDGLRTIMDCSKPADHSVNNFVDEISKTFSYKGVDDLVYNMREYDFIATLDIKDTHRAMSIHPSDCPFQAIRWDMGGGADLYFDNRL